MDVAYVLGAICIVYKLAFLIRQIARLPAPLAILIRAAGLLMGTLVALRAVHVFDEREHIAPYDVFVQLGWCLLLATVIVLIGRRRKVW